ncbi:MAG: 30S ribosomal protein S16 [bacterium]|nr:30S ribosomal protein S16 [bacterium]
MLTIRLSRRGKKKQPTYRLVVQEHTKDPWGDYLEHLGHYNPMTNPATLVIKKERIEHWIKNGAQPSDTVWNLLVTEGVVKGDKRRTSHITKKRREKLAAADAKRKEKEQKAAAPAAT